MHSDKDPSNAQIDTKSVHQQNLADELKTIRVDNEEHPEIMSKPETATFMSWLESKGITIPDSQTTREVLDDPNLFNMPLRPLLDKLGMSMEDARGIGMQLKEEITKVTGARFREYLTHVEWRSRLSSENLEVDELSSSEAMTQEEASAELFSILGSQDIEFAQGAVWNMATTKESKWVAKFIKAGNESNSEWVMREEMQQYREVLEVFGEDL
nr:hypothetical protein [Candidatus Saccharibacteria bacterium]